MSRPTSAGSKNGPQAEALEQGWVGNGTLPRAPSDAEPDSSATRCPAHRHALWLRLMQSCCSPQAQQRSPPQLLRTRRRCSPSLALRGAPSTLASLLQLPRLRGRRRAGAVLCNEAATPDCLKPGHHSIVLHCS